MDPSRSNRNSQSSMKRVYTEIDSVPAAKRPKVQTTAVNAIASYAARRVLGAVCRGRWWDCVNDFLEAAVPAFSGSADVEEKMVQGHQRDWMVFQRRSEEEALRLRSQTTDAASHRAGWEAVVQSLGKGDGERFLVLVDAVQRLAMICAQW